MNLNMRPCIHCKQTGSIYHINDDTFCRYCGKTQPRARPPHPRPTTTPLFLREAKSLRAKRFKRAHPPII